MANISGYCDQCAKWRKEYCFGGRQACMRILSGKIEAQAAEIEQLENENASLKKWNACEEKDHKILLEAYKQHIELFDENENLKQEIEELKAEAKKIPDICVHAHIDCALVSETLCPKSCPRQKLR